MIESSVPPLDSSHLSNMCIGGCGSCSYCTISTSTGDHKACTKEATKVKRRAHPTTSQRKGMLSKPREFFSFIWPKCGTPRQQLLLSYQLTKLYDGEISDGRTVCICSECKTDLNKFESLKSQGELFAF
jgi:hypothetical protein